MPETAAALIQRITQPRPGNLVTYVNLYSYRMLRSMPRIGAEFDVIHLDGFLMTWFFRLFGFRIPRVSFDMTSMAAEVFAAAEQEGARVYLLGGEAGVAAKAGDILRDRFPQLNILATRNGFFHDAAERRQVARQIVDLAPDIVIVGMGGGKQEEMLLDLKDSGYAGRGYTCGGFLHQTAMGKVDYYPAWINRLGLRWLYRCLREPKVILRVLWDYPRNAALLFRDYFGVRR